MTKRNRHKGEAKGVSHRPRVKAFGRIGNAPMVGGGVRTASGNWVRFGANNLFPEFCSALADNCSPLGACVDRMQQYIAGDGWSFEDLDGNPIEAAGRAWDALCGEAGALAHLNATARDLALMNTFAWEIIYSRVGPASVRHLDVCRVRAELRKERGIEGYYFSSNWRKSTDIRYKPLRIPAFGTGEAKELLYDKVYKELRDYYGEPHWLAAMADAEVLARIPVFNRTQIDGGFKPSVHAHLQTNADDADLDKLDEEFELAFTGEDGKPYILTTGATNETLTLTKLERGDHAGELDQTRKVSKEEIYHSYGIPPVLMGADVSTGLGGRGMAIEEELSMFQRTRVRPFQRRIEAAARRILLRVGIEVPVIRILPLTPFEPGEDKELGRNAYLRSVTVDEHRASQGLEPLGGEMGRTILMMVGRSGPAENNGSNG